MVLSDRPLNALAGNLAEEFEVYRDPDGFKEFSIIIDNSDQDRLTLIVYINREQAVELADRVEAFFSNGCAYRARTP